jgi:hypothetical protein
VMSCWDVVPLHELVEMMAMEETNSAIMKMCVELAFKSIHPSEEEKEKTTLNRVIWLIKQGQQVARNFYENSVYVCFTNHEYLLFLHFLFDRNVLPADKALEFMTKVVGRLGAFYRDFDKKGKSKKKEEPAKPVAKGLSCIYILNFFIQA